MKKEPKVIEYDGQKYYSLNDRNLPNKKMFIELWVADLIPICDLEYISLIPLDTVKALTGSVVAEVILTKARNNLKAAELSISMIKRGFRARNRKLQKDLDALIRSNLDRMDDRWPGQPKEK